MSSHLGTVQNLACSVVDWGQHKGVFTPVENAASYRVEMRQDGGAWSTLTTLAAGSSSFLHGTSLTTFMGPFPTTWEYRVVSIDSAAGEKIGNIARVYREASPITGVRRAPAGTPVANETLLGTRGALFFNKYTNAAIRTALGKNYLVVWSTDHDPDAGALMMGACDLDDASDAVRIGLGDGTFWTAANMPGGTPTGAIQTETPIYFYNADDPAGKPHYIYFHCVNKQRTVNASFQYPQETFCIRSAGLAADPATWELAKSMAVLPGDDSYITDPADPNQSVHTGYMHDIEVLAPSDYRCWSFLRGGSNSLLGTWRSTNLLDWTVESTGVTSRPHVIFRHGGRKWLLRSFGGGGGDMDYTRKLIVYEFERNGYQSKRPLHIVLEMNTGSETVDLRSVAGRVSGSQLQIFYVCRRDMTQGAPVDNYDEVYYATAELSGLDPPPLLIHRWSDAAPW